MLTVEAAQTKDDGFVSCTHELAVNRPPTTTDFHREATIFLFSLNGETVNKLWNFGFYFP